MTLFSRLAAAAALAAATGAFAQAPAVPPPPPLPPVGLELIWAAAGAQPPQGSQVLMGGFASGQPGGPLPVCRAAHQNGVHPGKFWQGRCYIGWGGQEVAAEKFEMLFFRPAPNLGQVSWVNAGGPTPPNAVVGGQEPGRQLGVCRTLAPNGWHPGKLIDGRCSIGFDGREVMAPQYQLLVQAGPAVAAPQAAAPVPTPQPPQVVDGIRVARADYGLNCRAPQSNVTMHVAVACNGKESCPYMVDHRVIGDPAQGCAKDYQIAYECLRSGQVIGRRAGGSPPEASGKVIQLSCAANVAAAPAPVPGPAVANPQGASALPPGSYSQSCTNASMSGGTLTASCRNAAGQMVPASLANADAWRGQDIANCDGRLQGGGCGAPASTQPQAAATTTTTATATATAANIQALCAQVSNYQGSVEDVAYLNRLSSNVPQLIQCLNPFQLGFAIPKMTAAQAAMLTPDQVGSATARCAAVSNYQGSVEDPAYLNQLASSRPHQAIQCLNPFQLGFAIPKMTAAQLGMLTAAQVGSATARCAAVSNYQGSVEDPAYLNQLASSRPHQAIQCLNNYQLGFAVPRMTPAQIGMLTIAQVQGLSAATLAKLAPPQRAALSR